MNLKPSVNACHVWPYGPDALHLERIRCICI